MSSPAYRRGDAGGEKKRVLLINHYAIVDLNYRPPHRGSWITVACLLSVRGVEDEATTGRAIVVESFSHWVHDVVATLNQRQWRWFDVATTSCAQCKLSPWLLEPEHTTLLRRWINVSDVDSTSQQRRVARGFWPPRWYTALTQCWATVAGSSPILSRPCGPPWGTFSGSLLS